MLFHLLPDLVMIAAAAMRCGCCVGSAAAMSCATTLGRCGVTASVGCCGVSAAATRCGCCVASAAATSVTAATTSFAATAAVSGDVASATRAAEAMAAPAVGVAPVGPWAYAEEDAVIEVARPIITIGRAGIGCIAVVAIGTDRLNTDANTN